MADMNNIYVNIKTNGIENNTSKYESASVNKSTQTIPMVSQYTEEELLNKLGITKEFYNIVLLKYPDAQSLSVDDLKLLVNKEIKANNSVSDNNETVISDNSKIEGNEVVNSNTEEELTETQKPFDKSAFIRSTSAQKAEVIALELAKNKFLYSDSNNPKTDEDWNNLTEEERQSFVKEYLSAVKSDKNGLAKILTKYGKSSIAESTMTKIQTANVYSMSFEDFQKLSQEKREEYIYSYLDSENRLAKSENRKPVYSKFEKQYWDRNNLLAESVNYYYEQKGLDSNICPGDVSRVLREENLNLEQIQFNYIDNKVKQGQNLSKYEKYQYAYLSDAKDNFETDAQLNKLANEESQELQDPPSLYSKIQSTEYAEKYNSALPNEKFEVLFGILKDESGNDKNVLYENLMASASDAYKTGDRALASDLVKMAKFINKDRYIAVDKNASATEISLKTKVMKDLSPEEASQLHKNIGNNANEAIAEAGGVALVAQTTEDQALEISYVGSKFAKVNNAMYDRITKFENIDKAEIGYTNVRNAATQETLNYVAANADKAQAELQNPVLKMFTDGNKEATQSAIEAKTVTRMYAQNQTEALNTLKNNAESLMAKDEAIKALNLLSDQIRDCDKSNQLDMHNSMMKSKYSEVQEHTARNIKDYDPTVQSQALDSVYKSGNEKAIDAAVESLSNTASVDIVDYNLNKTITNAVVKTLENNVNILENIDAVSSEDKTIREKVISGEKLSVQEYASLSPSEKREYITNYFKSLSPAQKIKLLSSISNASQKRSIYKMIARTNNDLFNRMITDPDIAKTILDMNLSNEINNQILRVANQKKNSINSFADISKEYGNDNESAANSEKNSTYNTNPYKFDAKELYLYDKNGNLVV